MKLITLVTALIFLPIIAAETRGGDKFYPDWSAVKKVEPASSQNEPTPTQASEQQKSESEHPRSGVGAQKQLTEKPRDQASTNAKAETGGVKETGSRKAESSKSSNELKVIGAISGSIEIGEGTSPTANDADIHTSGVTLANKGIPIHIKGELLVAREQLLQILAKTDQNTQVEAAILGPHCKDLINGCVNEQIEGQGQNGEKCQSYRQNCQKR